MKHMLAALLVQCSIGLADTMICTTPAAPCGQWVGLVGWRGQGPEGPITKMRVMDDTRAECRR